MMITKTSQWQLIDTYLGIPIYRRVERTGSHGGNCKTTACTVKTKREAYALIDNMREQDRAVWIKR